MRLSGAQNDMTGYAATEYKVFVCLISSNTVIKQTLTDLDRRFRLEIADYIVCHLFIAL